MPQPGRSRVTAGFDPEIARGLGFDHADLEFNRHGALSPGQIAAVSSEHTGMVRQSHVAAIVMGVFYLVVALACIIGAASDGGPGMALKVAGVFIALGVVAVVANIAHNFATRRHGPALRLHVVEGTAHCREDAESQRIHVGGITFFVAPSVFAAFEDGQCYRIYYVEYPFAHWRRPVSAEIVR